MDCLYGIIGFAGFEALRIYKRLWAGLEVIPERHFSVYVALLGILSGFAAACAHALANGNLANSLFIGFSVPTGIKAILEPAPKKNEFINQRREEGIVVDDVDVTTKNESRGAPRPKLSLKRCVRLYFG